MQQIRLGFFIAFFGLQPVLCCDLNSDQPLTTQLPSVLHSEQPREVVISNNNFIDFAQDSGVMQLHSAGSLVLLDKIDSWPTPSGATDSIIAEPAVVDFNYDGVTDAMYVIDKKGIVWFVELNAAGFEIPVMIADLSSSGASFVQPLRLVQYTTAGSSSAFDNQVMLLIIATTVQGNEHLIALKHHAEASSITTFSDLTNRSVITEDELHYGIDDDLWQQLQQATGWFIELDGRVVTMPEVYAGVIYFSTAQSSSVKADCTLAEDATQQLYAVHMHHAGLVYAKRNWLIETISAATLNIINNAEQQLQLTLRNDQQQVTVVDAMLAINALCADCAEELNAVRFPQVIRLATYQSETEQY